MITDEPESLLEDYEDWLAYHKWLVYHEWLAMHINSHGIDLGDRALDVNRRRILDSLAKTEAEAGLYGRIPIEPPTEKR